MYINLERELTLELSQEREGLRFIYIIFCKKEMNRLSPPHPPGTSKKEGKINVNNVPT